MAQGDRTIRLFLSPYEADLVAAAIDGLATQLGQFAEKAIHGPRQVAACHAVGALKSVARRLQASAQPPNSTAGS